MAQNEHGTSIRGNQYTDHQVKRKGLPLDGNPVHFGTPPSPDKVYQPKPQRPGDVASGTLAKAEDEEPVAELLRRRVLIDDAEREAMIRKTGGEDGDPVEKEDKLEVDVESRPEKQRDEAKRAKETAGKARKTRKARKAEMKVMQDDADPVSAFPPRRTDVVVTDDGARHPRNTEDPTGDDTELPYAQVDEGRTKRKKKGKDGAAVPRESVMEARIAASDLTRPDEQDVTDALGDVRHESPFARLGLDRERRNGKRERPSRRPEKRGGVTQTSDDPHDEHHRKHDDDRDWDGKRMDEWQANRTIRTPEPQPKVASQVQASEDPTRMKGHPLPPPPTFSGKARVGSPFANVDDERHQPAKTHNLAEREKGDTQPVYDTRNYGVVHHPLERMQSRSAQLEGSAEARPKKEKSKSGAKIQPLVESESAHGSSRNKIPGASSVDTDSLYRTPSEDDMHRGGSPVDFRDPLPTAPEDTAPMHPRFVQNESLSGANIRPSTDDNGGNVTLRGTGKNRKPKREPERTTRHGAAADVTLNVEEPQDGSDSGRGRESRGRGRALDGTPPVAPPARRRSHPSPPSSSRSEKRADIASEREIDSDTEDEPVGEKQLEAELSSKFREPVKSPPVAPPVAFRAQIPSHPSAPSPSLSKNRADTASKHGTASNTGDTENEPVSGNLHEAKVPSRSHASLQSHKPLKSEKSRKPGLASTSKSGDKESARDDDVESMDEGKDTHQGREPKSASNMRSRSKTRRTSSPSADDAGKPQSSSRDSSVHPSKEGSGRGDASPRSINADTAPPPTGSKKTAGLPPMSRGKNAQPTSIKDKMMRFSDKLPVNPWVLVAAVIAVIAFSLTRGSGGSGGVNMVGGIAILAACALLGGWVWKRGRNGRSAESGDDKVAGEGEPKAGPAANEEDEREPVKALDPGSPSRPDSEEGATEVGAEQDPFQDLYQEDKLFKAACQQVKDLFRSRNMQIAALAVFYDLLQAPWQDPDPESVRRLKEQARKASSKNYERKYKKSIDSLRVIAVQLFADYLGQEDRGAYLSGELLRVEIMPNPEAIRISAFPGENFDANFSISQEKANWKRGMRTIEQLPSKWSELSSPSDQFQFLRRCARDPERVDKRGRKRYASVKERWVSCQSRGLPLSGLDSLLFNARDGTRHRMILELFEVTNPERITIDYAPHRHRQSEALGWAGIKISTRLRRASCFKDVAKACAAYTRTHRLHILDLGPCLPMEGGMVQTVTQRLAGDAHFAFYETQVDILRIALEGKPGLKVDGLSEAQCLGATLCDPRKRMLAMFTGEEPSILMLHVSSGNQLSEFKDAVEGCLFARSTGAREVLALMTHASMTLGDNARGSPIWSDAEIGHAASAVNTA